ncbi:hypothetical protein [Desulfoferrobacter suflitae]|uniref:hypothetical protein n=1 Tax=Desulfoferrobacter suflitae TaxID=2865782 RepID=UPI0021642022|nr:hypothetical protein [Desulfoferrobacter suflitae]MCK8601636.1 hypothetical protein [Desulfoferrobacter suflitae]
MNRIRRLLKHSELLLLVSWLGFILFNWPLLGLFDLQTLEDIFLYLFLMWAIFILVLIIICIGYLRTDGV